MLPPLALLCCLVTPDTSSLGVERLFPVDRVVAHAVAAGGFPGATVAIGTGAGPAWLRGYGRRGWNEDAAAVDPTHTVYDLASLTKVIATTTAIMILYDQGKIRLDAPAARYLPAWKIGARAHVTVRDLLTHRSGLPPGRDLWRIGHTPAAARRAVLKTPLEDTPGAHYVYSDLGADILGFIVESVSGERLDQYTTSHIFRKLGMTSTRFRPPTSWDDRLARTEAPLGRVHDQNAAALGGVAGHAGLFSTAADLSIFAEMMLNGGKYHGVRIVRDSTVALFTRRAATGHRALGWDTCGGASCGQRMGETGFGHTGFTGTSLWIDPARDVYVIVLANWACGDYMHPVPPSAALSDVRADVADLAEVAAMAGDGEMNDTNDTLTLRSDGARGWVRGVEHSGW
jgi:CubicO group peptidase (beta-lactamase class C family)